MVVSIIGLLVALLLPSLKEAKESARRVVCLTHVRQMGIAGLSYVNDNRQQFMRVVWAEKGQIVVPNFAASQWLDELWVYGNKSVGMFECPSQDKKRGTSTQYLYGKREHYPGFLINRQVMASVRSWVGTDQNVPLYLRQFETPQQKVFFADSSGHDDDVPDSGSPTGYKSGRFGRHSWSPFSCLYSTNDSGNSGPVAWRHHEGPNLLFMDGHGAWMKRDDIWPKFPSDPADVLKYKTYWDPDGDGSNLTPRVEGS